MTEFIHKRAIVQTILSAINDEKKRLIRIIVGPRQVGKTTAALQIAEKWDGLIVNASADQPLPPGPEWIEMHWNRAATQRTKKPLLILDEIQKVRGWSETIKALWDQESNRDDGIEVLLLGSSSLLIHKGCTESLAGRFFLYRCIHWQLGEMESAFSFDMDQWIYYGGYPGAAPLINDENVWSQYIRDALIETVLAKDVLQLQTVAKPALLRHLFMLSTSYPAQILSYNKMLGQLQDAGNTTTLAHYVKLLESAFLLSGLEIYRKGTRVKQGSSPKLILWNNALINAVVGMGFEQARNNHTWWGRLVENAVGAYLLSMFSGMPYSLYYWRQRNYEVDFVVETPLKTWAIEVKSGKQQTSRGLEMFLNNFPDVKPVTIGTGGINLREFFLTDPKVLFV